jgi:hypothetical protein
MKDRKWKFWPIVGTLAVLLMWGVSASANGWAGYIISSDEIIKWVLTGASVSADAIKAIALFALVAALGNRRWNVALGALVMFTLTATWSMRSATYFASSMLTEHVAQRKNAIEAQGTDKDLLETKKVRLGFLAQQDTKFNTQNRREREAMLAERKRISEEMRQLSAEIAAMNERKKGTHIIPNSDPLATLLKLDDKDVVLATSLFFAIMLEVISGIGFWVIAQSQLVRARAEAAPKAPLAPAAATVSPARSATPPPVPKGGKPKEKAATPSASTERPRPFAGNVVALPRRSAPGTKAALQDQVALLVSELFEPGDEDDRVRVSEVTSKVNERLSRLKRLSNHQVRMMLIPLMLSLAPHAHKKKVGGDACILGVRMREAAGSAALQA